MDQFNSFYFDELYSLIGSDTDIENTFHDRNSAINQDMYRY